MSLDKFSLAIDRASGTSVPLVAHVPDTGIINRESSSSIPLVVDLDGTLLKTDLLWESILAALKQNAFLLLLTPFWLLNGRARVKAELARRVSLEVAALPYQEELLKYLREELGRGRKLVLATASDQALARAIADYLGVFSEVLASDGRRNMKGAIKLKALQDRFGDRSFDYAGNAQADVKIWEHSHAAIVVNAPNRIIHQAATTAHLVRIVEPSKNRLGALLQALRIKHWIKNALIFVPLLAAQELEKYHLLVQAVYGFAAFSLVASSVYVLNDLADVGHDRQHYQKRMRPFASGTLPLSIAFWLVPALFFAASLISMLLPPGFWAVIAGYFVLNLVYSFYLKRILLLDVIMLAIFYTLRVVAGGIATGLIASHWLLVFSVFLFLSLAFAKRVSELQALRAKLKDNAEGRGYLATDLEQLANLGAAAGYISVLVFVLYLDSPSAKLVYTANTMLWIVCPLFLYWISRLWVMVHRRQIPEDPIVFVFQDKVSWLVGAAIAVIMILAS
jgi:4-hydroxybenzoate polyprenyltransferase/phosphoserine phosphatase